MIFATIILLIFVGLLYVVIKEHLSLEKQFKMRAKERMFEQQKRASQQQKRGTWKKVDQERITAELNQLRASIIEDWNSAVFADKISTDTPGTVIYRKENGDVITVRGNVIEVKSSTQRCSYTVGALHRYGFVVILNRMIEIINAGNLEYREDEYQPNVCGSKKKTSDNPKRDLYETLMETIRLRKVSLQGMSYSDENRPALENELRVAERKANKMKLEYNL